MPTASAHALLTAAHEPELEASDDPPMGKRLRMATPTRTEDRLTPQAADWYALPVSLLPKPTRRSM